MGDPERADLLERAGPPSSPPETFGPLGRLKLNASEHSAHTFGFVAPFRPGTTDVVDIAHAGNIRPQADLKNERITITLNEVRVADYPGAGAHDVLFDFYAQNQSAESTDHLHFTQTFRAREGESIGTIGYPVFVGLKVGGEGAAFRCLTVNVKNEADEAVLRFLEGDAFKLGLRLVETAQPALAPLTSLAYGITRMVAGRNKNVPVQEFFMGLDFGDTPGAARLAEGLFVAVQIPERDTLVWDWSEWAYSPSSGRIVNRADRTRLVPYNFVAFGVGRYSP